MEDFFRFHGNEEAAALATIQWHLKLQVQTKRNKKTYGDSTKQFING
jgi:hypothetical protein